MIINGVFHPPFTSNRCYSLKCVDWHFLETCFNNLPAPGRSFGALCRAVKSGVKTNRLQCFSSFLRSSINDDFTFSTDREPWADMGAAGHTEQPARQPHFPGLKCCREKQRPPTELSGNYSAHTRNKQSYQLNDPVCNNNRKLLRSRSFRIIFIHLFSAYLFIYLK